MHAQNSSTTYGNSYQQTQKSHLNINRCFPCWIWYDAMQHNPVTPSGHINSMTIN